MKATASLACPFTQKPLTAIVINGILALPDFTMNLCLSSGDEQAAEKTAKKTTTKAKKKTEKKSKASIFDDDVPSIFDDPLNATSK